MIFEDIVWFEMILWRFFYVIVKKEPVNFDIFFFCASEVCTKRFEIVFVPFLCSMFREFFDVITRKEIQLSSKWSAIRIFHYDTNFHISFIYFFF